MLVNRVLGLTQVCSQQWYWTFSHTHLYSRTHTVGAITWASTPCKFSRAHHWTSTDQLSRSWTWGAAEVFLPIPCAIHRHKGPIMQSQPSHNGNDLKSPHRPRGTILTSHLLSSPVLHCNLTFHPSICYFPGWLDLSLLHGPDHRFSAVLVHDSAEQTTFLSMKAIYKWLTLATFFNSKWKQLDW